MRKHVPFLSKRVIRFFLWLPFFCKIRSCMCDSIEKALKQKRRDGQGDRI